MKIHLFDYDTEKEMPSWLKERDYKNYDGTACGYMRKSKNVTTLTGDVTCNQCLKLIKEKENK